MQERRRVQLATVHKGHASTFDTFGWFHQFGPHAFRDGQNGPVVVTTVAIIEGDDGIVHYCKPGEYRFLSKEEETKEAFQRFHQKNN